MSQVAVASDGTDAERRTPALSGETRRRLGTALRAVYEGSCDVQPIPDAQVDLLLRLRHRERDLRRAG